MGPWLLDMISLPILWIWYLSMCCMSIYLVNIHVQSVYRDFMSYSIDVIITFIIRKLSGVSRYHGLSSLQRFRLTLLFTWTLVSITLHCYRWTWFYCVFRAWMTFGRRVLSGLLFLPILRSLTVMSWRSGGQTHNELIMNMKSEYIWVIKRCVDYINF